MQQVEGEVRVCVGEAGRMGLYGQNCAEVAQEAECVQGRGLLPAPLLLFKSLGDGGMRDKGHKECPEFTHALSLSSPDTAGSAPAWPPHVPPSCVTALFSVQHCEHSKLHQGEGSRTPKDTTAAQALRRVRALMHVAVGEEGEYL